MITKINQQFCDLQQCFKRWSTSEHNCFGLLRVRQTPQNVLFHRKNITRNITFKPRPLQMFWYNKLSNRNTYSVGQHRNLSLCNSKCLCSSVCRVLGMVWEESTNVNLKKPRTKQNIKNIPQREFVGCIWWRTILLEVVNTVHICL